MRTALVTSFLLLLATPLRSRSISSATQPNSHEDYLSRNRELTDLLIPLLQANLEAKRHDQDYSKLLKVLNYNSNQVKPASKSSLVELVPLNSKSNGKRKPLAIIVASELPKDNESKLHYENKNFSKDKDALRYYYLPDENNFIKNHGKNTLNEMNRTFLPQEPSREYSKNNISTKTSYVEENLNKSEDEIELPTPDDNSQPNVRSDILNANDTSKLEGTLSQSDDDTEYLISGSDDYPDKNNDDIFVRNTAKLTNDAYIQNIDDSKNVKNNDKSEVGDTTNSDYFHHFHHSHRQGEDNEISKVENDPENKIYNDNWDANKSSKYNSNDNVSSEESKNIENIPSKSYDGITETNNTYDGTDNILKNNNIVLTSSNKENPSDEDIMSYINHSQYRSSSEEKHGTTETKQISTSESNSKETYENGDYSFQNYQTKSDENRAISLENHNAEKHGTHNYRTSDDEYLNSKELHLLLANPEEGIPENHLSKEGEDAIETTESDINQHKGHQHYDDIDSVKVSMENFRGADNSKGFYFPADQLGNDNNPKRAETKTHTDDDSAFDYTNSGNHEDHHLLDKSNTITDDNENISDNVLTIDNVKSENADSASSDEISNETNNLHVRGKLSQPNSVNSKCMAENEFTHLSRRIIPKATKNFYKLFFKFRK